MNTDLHLTFESFLFSCDFVGSVILLEGKRAVLEEDKPRLTELGKLLCREMKHARFRSGNAPGADELFSDGVAKIDPSRMEIILPYTGHRRQSSAGYQTHALDNISLAAEPEVTYHTRSDNRKAKLVDDFAGGITNRFTIKAAYLLRDTVKVIGTRSGISKATFALFYDDLNNPGQGGTGHTMQVCKNNAVPFADQTVWMGWLK